MHYNDCTPEQLLRVKTLAELKALGYKPKSIRQELRDNLIQKLRKKEKVFEGIWGYDDTVLPDVERAILSMHHILLLGLRGQAKTRIARLMVHLLDEYIPVIEGSELNDDPLQPLSRFALDQIVHFGDHTPVSWLQRDERYTEKLATPDVSVADLIGDMDPIKAATLKLAYSDERVIHFGLIPRSHRCIFVINELPDLQARIQVALFNILQEGDIQIRGFKLRLPLDIQFVFTANPEDYTNRGSIVTPLKDRIDSQIITHYPHTLETGRKITDQEARIKPEQRALVYTPELALTLIEQVAIEARSSEYVDSKSGVSARLTISAAENLYSAAERRALLHGSAATLARVSDLFGTIPSITGKVELVYEGEQEGAGIVAYTLLGKAIRAQFDYYFPSPDKIKKQKLENPFRGIVDWFGNGNTLDVLHDADDATYQATLSKVPGLASLVERYQPDSAKEARFFFMEFVLHGLAEFSQLSKTPVINGVMFKDLLSSMFEGMSDGGDMDEEDEENQR